VISAVMTSGEAVISAVMTSGEAVISAVMTSGEAVASAATPIDSVASCMVVTFVTAAPWAIAFVGRLSRGDSSLSLSLCCCAAAAHQL